MKEKRHSSSIAKMAGVLGRHWLIELLCCDSALLREVEQVQRIMEQAVALSGASIVESRFHQFSPFGVSGVIIIKESHFTVHTWPEHAYAAVDIFTCGNTIATNKAIDYLKEAFSAGETQQHFIERGGARH